MVKPLNSNAAFGCCFSWSLSLCPRPLNNFDISSILLDYNGTIHKDICAWTPNIIIESTWLPWSSMDSMVSVCSKNPWIPWNLWNPCNLWFHGIYNPPRLLCWDAKILYFQQKMFSALVFNGFYRSALFPNTPKMFTRSATMLFSVIVFNGFCDPPTHTNSPPTHQHPD